MIRATNWLAVVLLAGIPSFAATASGDQPGTALTISGERRISLDEDWRFYKGDDPPSPAP